MAQQEDGGAPPGRASTAGARLWRAAADTLVEEHREIQAGLDDLLACCQGPAEAESLARARDLSTSLLGRLVRHRQFGADLIYEAVHVDLGGET